MLHGASVRCSQNFEAALRTALRKLRASKPTWTQANWERAVRHQIKRKHWGAHAHGGYRGRRNKAPGAVPEATKAPEPTAPSPQPATKAEPTKVPEPAKAPEASKDRQTAGKRRRITRKIRRPSSAGSLALLLPGAPAADSPEAPKASFSGDVLPKPHKADCGSSASGSLAPSLPGNPSMAERFRQRSAGMEPKS